MNKKLMIMFAAIAIIAASGVFAQQGNLAATTVGASGQFSEATVAGNATAEGGNVTRVDLDGSYSTSKWQGFYGNVSASLVLGLGADIFYSFPDETVDAVYATTNSTFNWAAIEEAVAAEVDTAWSFGASSDQAEDIFTANELFDGVAAALYTTMEDGNFKSYILDQGVSTEKGDFAFGASVPVGGAVGFDGDTWEYELLVPVGAGTEVYYFFMSI